MTLEHADKKDLDIVRKLYIRAFPKEERMPFFLIKRGVRRGAEEILIAKEDGVFLGFACLVCDGDLAYLFYFAIDDTKRGKGNGSRILEELKKRYRGKRLFLAREQLDEQADHYEQRMKRHAFYLKNGFVDLPCQMREASVVYDVLGIGGTVKPAEYERLMDRWCGKWIRRMIRMSITEN